MTRKTALAATSLRFDGIFKLPFIGYMNQERFGAEPSSLLKKAATSAMTSCRDASS
jgi:hypothetical protein